MNRLPPSIRRVLERRGFTSDAEIDSLAQPALELPACAFPDMEKAVERIRYAIKQEEPIAIYADRDVDGLTGMAILNRSLRTLGAQVLWGSPLNGRGLERPVLNTLLASGAKVMILVDCGTNEESEIHYLRTHGVDVMIADHHRMPKNLPDVFAWIHPESAGLASSPAGCVMAFRLAEALWRSFIGSNDPDRLSYFLFDHLDLVALGILADRVPLLGENRMLVWHGLRRLAKTRKEGLSSLLRFFRLKGDVISVRQASWQIIPLLNAAGRLGQPQWAANLLLTEDPWTARECIDALLGLNTERRRAQTASADHFEKTVLEQCRVEEDLVLVATARDLEPSVTGLAAQSLVQKYGKPAFLFVEQGDDFVGSGRGTPQIDLFAWIERHQDLLVKFGGHQGAVGLTVRKSDFAALREGLLQSAMALETRSACSTIEPEAEVHLDEADSAWWESLIRFEPFGQGFEMPVFKLKGVDAMVPRSKRSVVKMMLKSKVVSWPAELSAITTNPKEFVATPQPTPKEEFPFKWIVHR